MKLAAIPPAAAFARLAIRGRREAAVSLILEGSGRATLACSKCDGPVEILRASVSEHERPRAHVVASCIAGCGESEFRSSGRSRQSPTPRAAPSRERPTLSRRSR